MPAPNQRADAPAPTPFQVHNGLVPSDRARRWAATMDGHGGQRPGLRRAHAGETVALGPLRVLDRETREALEDERLAPGATRARGAGERPRPEEPDPWRTCFERDRDRILHSPAFRRLAGKTQVFVFPDDHQRTRLTHALEVAQVARAIAAALGLHETLAEAIALGHDCGHGPFGHASEDALDPLVPGGFDHAPWGADVTLAPLNLTREVSDGIRNHSWSRPAPRTPEGEVCALADRIAYTTHDAEDASRAGVVDLADLPGLVVERVGRRRSTQLARFVEDVVRTSQEAGVVGMSEPMAETLGALRAWNYERIYLRPDSLAQARAVEGLLRALVEHYVGHPEDLPGAETDDTDEERLRRAVSYVAGMTDRFACAQAVRLLEWPLDRLPKGFDTPWPR
ncbi:HD domain-containing protein [Aciditerrimonas ferrireducens]|nr:HD domain-containing protein [Aciditerrimonas ferrireducens]MCK4177664.1 HD domain-containing protein [Aciditerrimonas ferrireducens]